MNPVRIQRGEHHMKFFASIIAAAVLTAGVAIAADKEAPTKPLVLEAKQGKVTFKHDTHKTVKCEVCHSDKGFPQEMKNIGKDKAHAVCHDCHKKEKKGPQKCVDCHKK